jgi:hypothetical protein
MKQKRKKGLLGKTLPRAALGIAYETGAGYNLYREACLVQDTNL